MDKKKYDKRSISPSSSSASCSYKIPRTTSSSKKSGGDDGSSNRFSFSSYKYELNKIICPYSRSRKDIIVDDTNDFWLFLIKYETIIKKNNTKTIKSNPPQIDLNEIPEKIVKEHTNKINLLKDIDKLYGLLPIHDPDLDRRSKLTKNQFIEFIQIVELYLNFKLKENCKQIRKIQETQRNLPVYQHRDEIIKAVQNERVVIIAGDTGCGKSTQVPQYLYHSGFNRIACTQPRRIACISLAKRVTNETSNEHEVGYQIRFEKHKNKNTKILFITEGLLLRQLSSDIEAIDYEVIILDEVHERHLHGDFLLGIVKCLIYQRPQLKIILMSATINIELFTNYFSSENAKVIQVPGRLYPIKLHYRPIIVENKYQAAAERFNARPYVQVMQYIDEKYSKTEKGDLLIFLSGLNEITSVVDAANEYAKLKENWIVLALHSTLSLAEQDKVFDYPPEGVRKCIVSTNIAETSVTIDGIRFVVDSGKVKEMSYDPINRMQRLKEFWISRASAEQRKGRAGRTGPGVCFRLYSEKEYEEMELYSTPELQRVPLDSLMLQMIAMGLPDARKFPFIEAPNPENIENAIISLKNLGALTENEELTVIGKTLSHLPVDIVIGKMLILSCVFDQVDPVLGLAAALSVQSPYTNRAYRDLDCQTLLKRIESDDGDPITLLNIYRQWLHIKYTTSTTTSSNQSSNNSRKWCRKHGLEEQRFYEITKLRAQFQQLLEDCNLLDMNKNIGNNSGDSTDRSIRYGELKYLRQLKYKLKKSDSGGGGGRRRMLKINFYDMESVQDDEDDQIDIRDVEFRLSNDQRKVQKLLSDIDTDSDTTDSFKDIIIIKLIITSGFYPQLAVQDEFNYCKSLNEQLFHTKTKGFVALHPQSYYGSHPECLQLHENDIEVPPDGYYSKRPLSCKHQLLCYLTLLETTKPYLMNTIRMPTAQTLFLFAQTIETNQTFTRIVCDSWLLLEFPFPESGQILLLKASKIRLKWNMLLNQRLKSLQDEPDPDTQVDKDPKSNSSDRYSLEHELESDLISYMRTNVSYTVHRLLAADLKTLYVGSGRNMDTNIEVNPFDKSFSPIPYKKGGIQLTENIFYNCLIETEWSINIALQVEQTPWKCTGCSIEYCFSTIDKLQHQAVCRPLQNNHHNHDELNEMDSKASSSKTIAYDCKDCNKVLYLTPIQILKHKKQHSSN
ncbi:probable ATP-dependent RNA helicase DHX34 [Chrysoperla carnea]|uniref:probable ATP-dependent RNA helicase DHX34 n=1 Tax=Chrysoperla carnea TaxID=189513 RepID=UPI001D08CFC5|nr:probable ATP-dependent RNA helicase DHX34 [Chrysoperla carnea]